MSSADPDSDGFTDWEEYRGFIQGCGSWSCHERTDSLWSNLFIDDQSGLLDIQAAHCVTGYNIELATNWPVLDSLNRHWLDFMFARTDYLTDPGYNPPYMTAFDQAVVFIINNDNLPDSVLGQVCHYHLPADTTALFRGPSGNCSAIEISEWNIAMLVNQFRNLGLPLALFQQVFEQRRNRTYLHELGHALGINHHVPDTSGSHDCVMKYETLADWPTDSAGWAQYIWGQGYLDDEYNCANEKGLRP